MSAMDLLLWSRGPALGVAAAVFLFGILLRLFEIFSLGRKPDLAPARPNSPGSGWRTIVYRSVPNMPEFRRSGLTLVAGYIFHIGLFVVVLFSVPHIKLIQSLFGISWPSLPTPLIDLTAVAALIALLVALINRIMDPVKRMLSRVGDYLAWSVTFLPLFTGYLAHHHLLLDYTLMLALHILSVELLLIVFPFTKLTHTFSLFISRWYNGEWFARKGVAS
jgi:nitrate reductase gamma subunit